MAEKIKSFEAGMEQLEALVASLEQGSLPLEKSFKAYEQGMHLISQLSALLDAGEARIAVLTEEGEAPFQGEAAGC